VYPLQAPRGARTDIDAFLNGEEPPSHSRYVLSLGWNAETKAFDKAHVQAIDGKAVVASLSELAGTIDDGECVLPRDSDLAGLARLAE
jgi:hypothetical protein